MDPESSIEVGDLLLVVENSVAFSDRWSPESRNLFPGDLLLVAETKHFRDKNGYLLGARARFVSATGLFWIKTSPMMWNVKKL